MVSLLLCCTMSALRVLYLFIATWVVSTADSLIQSRIWTNKRSRRAYHFLHASQTQVDGSSSATQNSFSPRQVNGRVCVLQSDQEQFDQVSKNIADELGIPLLSMPSLSQSADDNVAYDHALVVEPYDSFGIGINSDYAVAIQPIQSSDMKRFRKSRSKELALKDFAMKPVFIDFCPKLSVSEQQTTRSGKDLLVQAVAPRRGGHGDSTQGACIYDLTAGFGQDALVLAKAGARAVTMVERDPIVFALLHDAQRRMEILATHCPNNDRRRFARELYGKLSLVHADGTALAHGSLRPSNDSLPDVVYIDQMFPPRTKRASVKKNMQILHSLLSSQDDSMETRALEESALLQTAHSLAQARVVCKRPLNAAPVGMDCDVQPSYSVRGTTNRWDVYIK
ncbi:hypothetical protein MPSEU_000838200 [Mayamaea pseudoterrestris]|nr:hypothetical protein MPSEU_000838200 [Mayamaea pseudoterrestris]